MTMKCRKCDVVLDLTGKCQKCGNQSITITGNAKVTMTKDNSEVRFEA